MKPNLIGMITVQEFKELFGHNPMPGFGHMGFYEKLFAGFELFMERVGQI